MATVQIKGVSKHYAENSVLNSLDLELSDGECFPLLGPSGCGKTVLMRLIAGFEKPDAGVISIDGTPVASATEGKVSVSYAVLAKPNWYTQTQCGFLLWQLMQKYISGGRWYNGLSC